MTLLARLRIDREKSGNSTMAQTRVRGGLDKGGVEGDKTRRWIRATFTKWNKPEK